MKPFLSTLAAALFVASATLAHAQAPAGGDAPKGPDAGPGGPGMMGGPGGHGHRMQPCSQEADPAKCEATRKQFRENMKAAHEACKDKPDRRACMTEQYCAKQSDPAKCKERADQMRQRHATRMDEHQAMAEACTGKRGDALQKCYQEQHEKHQGAAPAKK